MPTSSGTRHICSHARFTVLSLIASAFAAGCGSGSAESPRAADNQATDSPAKLADKGVPSDSSPSDSSAVAPSGHLFTDITLASGIDFIHETGEDGTYQIAVPMAGGAAVFDADGDDRLDIYLINGGNALPTSGKPSTATNRFFKQRPDGSFYDATGESGLGDAGYGIACAVGDLDNDGDLDVYVSNWGQDALYRNNGDGTFTNITNEAGIHSPGLSASVAFLDYDRDGLLDVYVTNYVVNDPTITCTDVRGRREYCGPSGFPGDRDILFRNEGDMRFRDVSVEAGIANVAKQGLGVIACDFNGDGWVDIFVANDGVDNFLWINNRDGTFTNQAHARGVAVNRNGQPEASMGIALGDVNGDDLLDIFLTHLHRESNTLYINEGPDVGFSDRTPAANLVTCSLEWTGFGVVLFDMDHDGLLELAVANGAVHRREAPLTDTPEFWCDYAEPNQLLRHNGLGRFEDISSQSGTFAKEIEVSRALVAADFDNDGDLDLLVTNLEGPARLYRRDLDVGASGHAWLQVRAVIPELKRDAVGAVVTVVTPTHRVIRAVTPSVGYASSNSGPLHFGLGSEEQFDRIEVIWPDGSQETFAGGEARRVVTLRKGEGTSAGQATPDRARNEESP